MELQIQTRLLELDKMLRLAPEKAYSFGEILRRLNEVLEDHGEAQIGDSTLKNDFKLLKEKFGAKVGSFKMPAPSHSGKQYHYVRCYEEETSIEDDLVQGNKTKYLKVALRQLNYISGNPLIDELRVVLYQQIEEHQEGGHEGRELYVHLDSNESYEGQKYIQVFLNAIQDKVALQFEYHPFGADVMYTKVSPYLLKQYNQRWYCIGTTQDGYMRNMALDRVVSEPKRTAGFQKSKLDREDWNDRFQEIVGVSYNERADLENIHLRFYGKSRYYVKTKPLSLCQRPLTDEDLLKDPMDVFLEGIQINFELKQQIMFYRHEVEVVSPAYLREEVHTIFQEAANRNK